MHSAHRAQKFVSVQPVSKLFSRQVLITLLQLKSNNVTHTHSAVHKLYQNIESEIRSVHMMCCFFVPLFLSLSLYFAQKLYEITRSLRSD